MAELPKSMKQFTHLCVLDFPPSTERHLAALIAGLMRHINAPSFHQACCSFHSTAIHLSFALGSVLSRPCKPFWMPITSESEACDKCGLIVSMHGTCCFCGLSTPAANPDCVSDRRSNAKESLEVLVKREVFTNACVNLLRHVGTTDLTIGIEFLLATAVDLSTQPKW